LSSGPSSAESASGRLASVISLTLPLFGVIQTGLRQEITPDELQGTAAAGVSVIALSSVPVGFVLGGLVAEQWGTGRAILIGSIAMTSGFRCVPLVSRL
jgi:hypothetical protein